MTDLHEDIDSAPVAVEDPEGRAPSTVLTASLGRALTGVSRIIVGWPGMVVLVLVYAAVAGGLSGHSYSNLWGALGAAVIGVAWYLSPLGRWEARRRAARPTAD